MTAHRTAIAHSAATRRRRRRLAAFAALALAPAAVATVVAAPSNAAPLPGATVTRYDGSRPTADAAAAAATKPTGSIVFVKNDNVWIMGPDGSGQRAVTTNGTAAHPYRSPSQSDTGAIIAVRDTFILRMTQAGKVLNKIDPPALVDSAGEHLDGPPTEASISPNGKTIAWTFSHYGCPPGLSCGVRLATGYTASWHLTPVTDHATSFYGMPSWIGSQRTLQTGTTSAAEVQDIDRASVHWFYDGDYAASPNDLTDGEISDDGKQVVMTRGWGQNMTILTYTLSGPVKTGVPALPVPNCLTNASPNVGSPTFAPGGAALAYSYPAGIYILNSARTCGGTTQPVLAVPGGTHPDWSKAPLA